jgi:hypothetical protein
MAHIEGALDLSKWVSNVLDCQVQSITILQAQILPLVFKQQLKRLLMRLINLETLHNHIRRCSIIEVMGRYSGDLALFAGICGGAEFIITPENPMDKDVK